MIPANSNIQIRQADRELDARLLAAIAEDTFVTTYGHLYAASDVARFLERRHSRQVYRRLIADREYALWLATDRGEPVAYAVAGPCALPAPDRMGDAGEIKRLYVSAARRGGGLGGRLMDCMLHWLAERHGDVFVSVFSGNEGAQRFYTRYGFLKVHEYYFEVGDHRDHEWIMKRSS